MTHHDADTIDPRNRTIADDEPVMLLVHPAVRPGLFALLNACGLDAGYAPFLSDEEGPPVFLIAPLDRRFKDEPVDGA